MFLKTNDRIINLKNVSNINVQSEGIKKRIIFNLNYTIEISNYNTNKFISDYVYWDAVSDHNLVQNLKYLEDHQYFKDNFINKSGGKGFININEISSIKFAEKKHRVIFNLSHPITFKDHDGNERITSEFVYSNCKSFEEYKEYKEYVNNKIGEVHAS